MPTTMTTRIDAHAGKSKVRLDESSAYMDLIQLRARVTQLVNRLGARLISRIAQMRELRTAHPDDADRETRSLQQRVGWLGQLAAGLAIIDVDSLPMEGAGYGSVVTVEDIDSSKREEYTLMVGSLVDIAANQVSMASPVGRALLGRVANDEISIDTPQKTVRWRVISVRTLNDLLECDEALDALE